MIAFGDSKGREKDSHPDDTNDADFKYLIAIGKYSF